MTRDEEMIREVLRLRADALPGVDVEPPAGLVRRVRRWRAAVALASVVGLVAVLGALAIGLGAIVRPGGTSVQPGGGPPQPGSTMTTRPTRSTGPYPRGAFEWCPNLQGTLAFGPDPARAAAVVARQFDAALVRGDLTAAAALADPSSLPFRAGHWASTVYAGGLRVLLSAPARSQPGGSSRLIDYGCGPRVAARAWVVELQDAEHTVPHYFWLVRRESGWRAFGSY